MAKFADADGDGVLELLVAADFNPFNRPLCTAINPPGALYEMYELNTVFAGATDGFIQYVWRTRLPNSSIELTPLSPTPWPGNTSLEDPDPCEPSSTFAGYTLGTPIGGIEDLNNDGREEIVVTELVSGQPKVKIIDGASGNVTNTNIQGVCIDVTRLQTGSSLSELVVWNPSTSQHKLYRSTGSGYGFSVLTESPSGTLSGDTSLVLVKKQFPDDFVLDSRVGLNTGSGHYGVTISRSGGTRAIVGESGCAVRSWTANGSLVQPSLNSSPRPGTVINVIKGVSNTNWTWLAQLESTCGTAANQIDAFSQSGSLLVTTGNLNVPVTGTDTIGTYVSSTAAWFLRNSNSPGAADLVFTYGTTGQIPLAGDWNGDGLVTAGTYASATSTFFLRNTNSGGAADVVVTFGAGGAGYVPIVGDWDGDGKDTVGLYHPASGVFLLRYTNSPGAADVTVSFGATNLTPVVGDWDGDGVDSVGTYVAGSGVFFLTNSLKKMVPTADYTFGFGAANSTPIVGDWNNDGVVTIGTYVSASGVFNLRNSNSAGAADLTFSYGAAGSTPVTGNWDGF